jgi:hypothetical protein
MTVRVIPAPTQSLEVNSMHTTDDGIRNLVKYALEVSRNDVATAIRFLCDLRLPFAEAYAAVEEVIGLDEARPPQCNNPTEDEL